MAGVFVHGDLPAAGRYAVSIDAFKGPEQAQIQLFRHEVPVGDAVDLYAADRARSEFIRLGTVLLEEGPNNLTFKLTGRHEQAQGLALDLISIQLERVE